MHWAESDTGQIARPKWLAVAQANMAQQPSLLGPEATGLARLVWLEHGQAWRWSALAWLDMVGVLAWP
jgi:hypothetical protein